MARKKGLNCEKVPTAAGRGACKVMKAAKGHKLVPRKSAKAARKRVT